MFNLYIVVIQNFDLIQIKYEVNWSKSKQCTKNGIKKIM